MKSQTIVTENIKLFNHSEAFGSKARKAAKMFLNNSFSRSPLNGSPASFNAFLKTAQYLSNSS